MAVGGPHTIDRFASVKTKQLDRFCSKFLNPGCEAVDAFTVSWAGDYNWLFAPPYLVPRVLRHMRDGREDGTLLVPEWPSAPWWPLFAKHGSWHGFVTASLRIQPLGGSFHPGRDSNLFCYCRSAIFLFTGFEVVFFWCTCFS